MMDGAAPPALCESARRSNHAWAGTPSLSQEVVEGGSGMPKAPGMLEADQLAAQSISASISHWVTSPVRYGRPAGIPVSRDIRRSILQDIQRERAALTAELDGKPKGDSIRDVIGKMPAVTAVEEIAGGGFAAGGSLADRPHRERPSVAWFSVRADRSVKAPIGVPSLGCAAHRPAFRSAAPWTLLLSEKASGIGSSIRALFGAPERAGSANGDDRRHSLLGES